MPTLLNIVGLDEKGELVTADYAVKGKKYICPNCDGELILRKSGNWGFGSKSPHFAHKSNDKGCSSESIMHYYFKIKLFDLISDRIKKNESLPIKWECSFCNSTHNGDLIKKVKAINKEYNFGNCRADLCLFTEEGRPHAVIEIIYSHKPTSAVKSFYKDNEIILIEYHTTCIDDYTNIEERAKRPDFINFCTRPEFDIFWGLRIDDEPDELFSF